jgi:hypothetical protein
MKFTPHKGQLIGIKYLVTHPEAFRVLLVAIKEKGIVL